MPRDRLSSSRNGMSLVPERDVALPERLGLLDRPDDLSDQKTPENRHREQGWLSKIVEPEITRDSKDWL
jgi:hypothetical protein